VEVLGHSQLEKVTEPVVIMFFGLIQAVM
jgi:hypothetical protein